MHKFNRSIRYDYGFSLIELMIAMALGLLIIGAIGSVFLATSQTYRTQEAMSQVQESGRFGIEKLSRDIRQTGFLGSCLPGRLNNLLDLDSDNAIQMRLFDMNNSAIQGWHQSTDDDDDDIFSNLVQNYVPDTDTLLVRHATSTAIRPSAPTDTMSQNLTTAQFDSGQILLLSDAESCDLFQHNPNASQHMGNRSSDFSRTYDEDAEVHALKAHFYYLGASTATPGQNALRRIDFNNETANDQELITGVAEFRLRYGLDTNNNGRIDTYVNASGVPEEDWNRVLAVRLYLIVNSPNIDNVADQNQRLLLEDIFWEAPDRRLHQLFSSTVGIRNRLGGG